jgi:hypothetical protein
MNKKTIILVLLILIGIICVSVIYKNNKEMFGIFKPKNKIETFWKWFSENEKELRNFETNPDKYLNLILSKGQKIESGLAFELQPPIDGIINMTVSADGVIELFPLIKEIVDKSPKINGWDFIAFRQRMTKEHVKGMILKSDNHEINPSEMYFSPLIEGDNIDIIVYIRGVTEENYNQIGYGGLLLLDNLLGEYDCVTKVRSYDFHNMPTNEEKMEDLIPLLELAEYIDNRK